MRGVKSPKAPRLRYQRNYCLRQARLAEHPIARDAFVHAARKINGVLTRSHQRATVRFDELRAVLDSLNYEITVETIVFVLISVTMSRDAHGHIDGLNKQFIAAYGQFETCNMARKTAQGYDASATYFCQKELLK